MFLTLGVMPGRAVVVWRDVKHSTSAWRGGGKNTHDLPVEVEVQGRHSGMYSFAS
jgi:hypothetical protein